MPDHDHIDVEHYCVHFYNDHLDVHAVHDDQHEHDVHRPLDHDEHAAFICALIERAIHDNPALVLDCIDDDHDFLRALDNRRRSNHIDNGPHGYPGGAAT